MHKAGADFHVQIAKLKHYLESDLLKAVATLERMSSALDRYAEQQSGKEGEGASG